MTHDYSDGALSTVTLVVRAHCKYGAAKPGERVTISRDEASLRVSTDALMTEAAYAAEVAKRGRVKAPVISKIKSMVEEGLAKLGLPPSAPA